LKWNDVREGKVFITSQSGSQSFKVSQKGFDYQIIASEIEKGISDYAEF
jgi:hypothetical protein